MLNLKNKISFGFLAVLLITFIANSQATNAQNASLIKSVVSLTGNVYNEITKQPETVAIIVYDEANNKIASTRSIVAENGYYYLTNLKFGTKYKVVLKKKDFFEEVWNLIVPTDSKYVELSHDFLIKPMELNIEIPISVPPFELNKSKMRFGAEELLNDLKQTLAHNEKVKFLIISYPDNDKDSKLNEKLTTERATALQQFFVSGGIDASRVSSKGSSKTDPKNPPPSGKSSKGKRYIGTSYIKVLSF